MSPRARPAPIELPKCVQVASLGCLYAPELCVVVASSGNSAHTQTAISQQVMQRGGVGDLGTLLRQVEIAKIVPADAALVVAAMERGVAAGFGVAEAQAVYRHCLMIAHTLGDTGARGADGQRNSLARDQIVRHTTPTRI